MLLNFPQYNKVHRDKWTSYSIHILYLDIMEAYGVVSWGKLCKIGLLLASLLYLIQPILGTSSSQYCQYEKMVYQETYGDFVDGSWVISLGLSNDGTCDMTGWIDTILMGDIHVEDQAFDLFFIDKDNLLHADNLNTRIEFTIPDGMYEFIQFKLPVESVSENSIEVHIHSKGAMDYYWTIDVDRNQLMYKLPFDLEVIREKFAQNSIIRYDNYLLRRMIESTLKWVPSFFIICLDFGVLLSLKFGNNSQTYSYYAYYGYTKTRAFSARMNGYLSKHYNPDAFDGYTKTRIYREQV